MNSNPVVWFEIYVQDMARAKQFYERVFETKLEKLNAPGPEMEMWTFPSDMQQYGACGALVRMDGYPVGTTGTLVYFHCEDCAVEEKRVAACGGRVERSKFSIGEHGHIALVHDTEGNMIGLHSM